MRDPAVFKERERKLDLIIGAILRAGVILAAAVVLAGAVFYLSRYGGRSTEFHVFHGEPVGLRRVDEIISGAFGLHGRALIQLGLLLLIATPIFRVLFSVFAFALQRDYTYVIVTLIVFALLLYSLLGGVG